MVSGSVGGVLIDHDDVHGRMVDLGYRQRKTGVREVTFDRFILFGRSLPALTLLQFETVRKGRDSLANSIGMRLFLYFVFETLQLNFFNDSGDIGSFRLEIDLLDGVFDDGVDPL